MALSGSERGPFFEPPLPRLLAHRGLATAAVENTLPAFEHALSLGTLYLECDVHASRDGVAVIAHDPDLGRMLGSDQTVESLTVGELASIDLGGGAGITTLEQALTAFPEARFNIDVKSLAAAVPAAEAILACHAVDRVLITSFSNRRRLAALRLLPGAATSASARTVVRVLLAAKLGLGPLARLLLSGIDALQVPEVALGMRVATPRVLSIIHSAGVEVHLWTINDPVRMAELLDLGVDGIITDRIDLALDLVRQTKR